MVEYVEGAGVVAEQMQQGGGFVGGQFLVGSYFALQLHEALEVGQLPLALAQAALVEYKALHEVLAQGLGGPLPKLGAPL